MTRLRADAVLLFAAAIWGVAFLFQKSAMEHIGPLAFIGARGIVAALPLAPLAWRETGGTPVSAGLARISVLGGALFFVAAWLQQAGLKTTTVTNTGFITALYVVITPFIAWLWYRKPPPRIVWFCVALSMAGTWLLGGADFGTISQGDMLVAFSAFFWAVHVVVTAQAAKYARPIAFTAIQFAVVSIIGIAAANVLEITTLEGLNAASLAIAYVGLMSGALTFTLLSIALQYTPPSEAAVIVSMETVFAAVAAYTAFDERLTPIGWLGAALILLSIVTVQVGSARS